MQSNPNGSKMQENTPVLLFKSTDVHRTTVIGVLFMIST